jgi:flagellar hook protein FlgE
MMRSLFAGVSGLKNHQIQMDVIGNNIANVNTVGYKTGRVTFEESLTQMLQDASRSRGTVGGINPQQVGLGMSVGSIDNEFTQGNLETTGTTTDLAIQGSSFFVLSDGQSEYYTRAGNFVVDGDGQMVAPKNGFKVQGRMADSQGIIASGTPIKNILLPFGQKAPAKATSEIQYYCNLDSDSQGLAQIWSSDIAGSAKVTGSAAPGLTITAGANDTLTITIDDDLGGTTSGTLTLGAATYSNASNLVAEINNKIDSDSSLRGEVKAEIDSSGTTDVIRIRTTDQGGSSTTIELSGNAAAGLNLSTTAQSGTVATSELNSLPITANALTSGDIIRISGTNPDGTAVSVLFTYGTLAGQDGTTVNDLINKLNSAFSGSVASLSDEGAILLTDSIRGETQTSVTLTYGDEDASGTVVNFPGFNSVQTGRNAGTHTASITVYDSKGATHTVSMTFENTSSEALANIWSWQATVDNGDIIPSSGNKGKVRFKSDGSMEVFNSDDGQSLTFDPGNGAETMSIGFDAGAAGSFGGITQLRSSTTTVAKHQDGYSMGNLQTVSIADNGEITGHFSNGVSQSLAQIVLANFNNPAGLKKTGDNLFEASANSGTPVKGTIGGGIQGTISSGALEMSNVDLAQEFTDMIVAQRGFQANARTITTADTLLQEIIQLKR